MRCRLENGLFWRPGAGRYQRAGATFMQLSYMERKMSGGGQLLMLNLSVSRTADLRQLSSFATASPA